MLSLLHNLLSIVSKKATEKEFWFVKKKRKQIFQLIKIDKNSLQSFIILDKFSHNLVLQKKTLPFADPKLTLEDFLASTSDLLLLSNLQHKLQDFEKVEEENKLIRKELKKLKKEIAKSKKNKLFPSAFRNE